MKQASDLQGRIAAAMVSRMLRDTADKYTRNRREKPSVAVKAVVSEKLSGSLKASMVQAMEVGGSTWFECNREDYDQTMRDLALPPESRRHASAKGLSVTMRLYTAVPTTVKEEVRYLICVTRTS